jgi:hypothetical protein
VSVARSYVVRCDEGVAILCAGAIPMVEVEGIEEARLAATYCGWVSIGRQRKGHDVCPACREAIIHPEKRKGTA